MRYADAQGFLCVCVLCVSSCVVSPPLRCRLPSSCHLQHSVMPPRAESHLPTRMLLNRRAACKQPPSHRSHHTFICTSTQTHCRLHLLLFLTPTLTVPNCGFIVIQFPTATSQQMDDLFDILIESGGMYVLLA